MRKRRHEYHGSSRV